MMEERTARRLYETHALVYLVSLPDQVILLKVGILQKLLHHLG
jgi:Txe/YoeB family toxin of Txe-Axe toxin-antitoxin module